MVMKIGHQGSRKAEFVNGIFSSIYTKEEGVGVDRTSANAGWASADIGDASDVNTSIYILIG